MSVVESLTEHLILQVKNRPVLWDKKHEMYGNVQAMDHEWNKLCVLMRRDKEYLKKRWRRVRDVFRIEIKKLKAPDNPTQPLISYYTGVWPHFESMLFLKDSLTKRTPRLFFPENEEPFSQEETISNPQEDTSYPQEITTEATDDEEEELDKKPVFVENWAEEKTEREERAVKRKTEDWGPVLDEDVNFAKSIVGYLRRLNPIKKLLVRNEIQSILLRELLCDKCRCNGKPKACQCE